MKKIKNIGIVVIIVILISSFSCENAVRNAKKRLQNFPYQTVKLSYGKMNYIDEGQGEVILSLHGIFGGYDQAFESASNFVDKYRVIAPSRFGYLGSDFKGTGSVDDQVDALIELLDQLKVDQVFLLGTSAGGTVATRFALKYPERVKGLILYSSDLPDKEPASKMSTYIGPPRQILNNYLMYISSPFFEVSMGMPNSTIYSMLPVDIRYDGIVNDATNVNTDYSLHQEKYFIQNLSVKSLIINARDDKVVKFDKVSKNVRRIQQVKFITFDTGGHLLRGHGREVEEAVIDFIENYK